MRTPETPLKLDFTGRAKTNDVAVARLIGFEAKEIADGRATVVLEAGPQHANPMGTLHGGILCDIADAAMGMAFASTLAPGESFTTVELKINFFPARMAGSPASQWQSGAARSQSGLCRVRNHRRTRPARCQGSLDLSRAARGASERTLALRRKQAQSCYRIHCAE